MKILFIVPYAPTRIRTRPYHLIRALRSGGHDVTVATLWSTDEEREALETLGGDTGRVMAERLPATRSLWNCVRGLVGGAPLQAHFSWSPQLADRLREAVDRTAFDVVHVEHLRGVRYGLMLADRLRDAPGRPALVWDSVDCISSLFRRAARESEARRVRLAARLELPRTEHYEGRIAARFDRVLVTSEDDRRELLQLAGPGDPTRPYPRVDVVPNGVDLEYFSPGSEPREPLTLVMTGKMSYHANATAVRRFVEEVMPSVWSELPAVRLWVVGKDPSPEVLRLGRLWKAPFARDHDDGTRRSRVLITGTVPDVRPFLRRATLAVAPIRYGVGIQNKVLEAMACGTPVLASAQAVTGVSARPGEHLAVASTPAEMVRSVVALLKEPERRVHLAEAGRAFVERQHDWLKVGASVSEIYRSARA